MYSINKKYSSSMSIKESLIISVSSVSGSGGSASSAYSSSDKKDKDSDSTEEGLKVNICNCKKTCNINTSCCTTNSCEKKSNCCDKYTELKPLCIESLFNTSECSRYENALSKAKISRNSFFSAKALKSSLTLLV